MANLTPENNYQFPPTPAKADLGRNSWNAVMGSLSARLVALEAKRTELQDLIDDLSFNGQQRIDEAISPLIEAQEQELAALSDLVQQAIIDATNAGIEVAEQVELQVGILEGRVVDVESAMAVILADTLPAENVAESATRVFVSPEQRDAVANLDNNYAQIDEDGLIQAQHVPYADHDDVIDGVGDGLISAAMLPSAVMTRIPSGYAEFLISGTWTKPDNASWVMVEVCGGGGGGADGTTGGAGSQTGGGGGSGSPIVTGMFVASDVPSSVPVLVGAGGLAGNDGGVSSFGSMVQSLGGNGAVNRTGGHGVGWFGLVAAGNPTGYEGTQTSLVGALFGTSGGGSTSSIPAKAGGSSAMSTGGGGGGGQSGGIHGASGGIRGALTSGGGGLGGAGSIPGSQIPMPGGDGAPYCGGGGGGYARATGDPQAGNGGNGGLGAGGGGGGGAETGSIPGLGGKGGDGFVRVWWG